jgi:hypothetical protein
MRCARGQLPRRSYARLASGYDGTLSASCASRPRSFCSRSPNQPPPSEIDSTNEPPAPVDTSQTSSTSLRSDWRSPAVTGADEQRGGTAGYVGRASRLAKLLYKVPPAPERAHLQQSAFVVGGRAVRRGTARDVVVVRTASGQLRSTPFEVRNLLSTGSKLERTRRRLFGPASAVGPDGAGEILVNLFVEARQGAVGSAAHSADARWQGPITLRVHAATGHARWHSPQPAIPVQPSAGASRWPLSRWLPSRTGSGLLFHDEPSELAKLELCSGPSRLRFVPAEYARGEVFSTLFCWSADAKVFERILFVIVYQWYLIIAVAERRCGRLHGGVFSLFCAR